MLHMCVRTQYNFRQEPGVFLYILLFALRKNYLLSEKQCALLKCALLKNILLWPSLKLPINSTHNELFM